MKNTVIEESLRKEFVQKDGDTEKHKLTLLFLDKATETNVIESFTSLLKNMDVSCTSLRVSIMCETRSYSATVYLN